MSRGVWTPERAALFRAELPDNTDPAALLARLNALPGAPIASEAALKVYAHKKGLRRKPEALLALQRAAGAAANQRRLTNGGPREVKVWTEARDARLIEGRASGEAPDDTLAALNAMHGVPVASVHALRGRLKALRQTGRCMLPKKRAGAPPGTMPKFIPRGRTRAVVAEPTAPPPPPAPPVPHPSLADAAAEARTERVKDAIRRSMKAGRLPWESAVAIAARHGVSPQRVLVLVGIMR